VWTKFLPRPDQEPLGLLIYFHQIGSESVSAIDVVDQVCELVVRDCFLIVFQDAPSRLAAENADVVRAKISKRQEQQTGREQGRALHDHK